MVGSNWDFASSEALDSFPLTTMLGGHRSSPNWLTLFGSVIGASFILFLAPSFLPDRLVYWREFAQAEEVIQQINRYQQQHHRLPVSLEALGRKDLTYGSLYYDLITDSSTYTLWFPAGTHGFFGSLVYNPQTRQWRVAD